MSHVATATMILTKSAIARIRDISKFLAPIRVFVVGLLKDVRRIPPRPTPVAIARNFETKYAITLLVWKISLRFLHTAVCFCFWVGLLNEIRQIYHDQSLLPWQRNLTQNRRIGDLQDPFV